MKKIFLLIIASNLSFTFSFAQTSQWLEAEIREKSNPMEEMSYMDQHKKDDVFIQSAAMPQLMSLPKTQYEIYFYHMYAKELIESKVYVSTTKVYQKAIYKWQNDTTLNVCFVVPSLKDSLCYTVFGFKGGSGIVEDEKPD